MPTLSQMLLRASERDKKRLLKFLNKENTFQHSTVQKAEPRQAQDECTATETRSWQNFPHVQTTLKTAKCGKYALTPSSFIVQLASTLQRIPMTHATRKTHHTGQQAASNLGRFDKTPITICDCFAGNNIGF
jgi:hypothetical protein